MEELFALYITDKSLLGPEAPPHVCLLGILVPLNTPVAYSTAPEQQEVIKREPVMLGSDSTTLAGYIELTRH